MARSARRSTAARYLAPALFLLGVTVAVLLIRSGLGGSSPATTHLGPVTHTSTASVPATTTVRSAPAAGTATTITFVAGGSYYTVRSGDTFGSIAAKESTSVTQLEQLNPGISSNSLRVGQKIRVK